MVLPYLVGGYFNIILSKEEKYRGLHIYTNEVDDFAYCIDICSLYDLGLRGVCILGGNGKSNDACIFKRLDMCLANQQFLNIS